MNVLDVTMLGGSGVGKTSLLAAMSDRFDNSMLGTELTLAQDHTTASQLSKRLGELRDLAEAVRATIGTGIKTTIVPTTYNFELYHTGRSNKSKLQLRFKDYPGEYFTVGEGAKLHEVQEYIENSVAVLVAIDAAALMEEKGRWHEKVNQTSLILNLFKRVQLTSPKLVILAPVKCETYVRTPRGSKELQEAVQEQYKYLLRYLNSAQIRNNVAVVITPVQTVGNLTISAVVPPKESGERPQFYFRPHTEGLGYSPSDSEQPLRYLLRFVLKRHYEHQQSTRSFQWLRDLLGRDAYLMDAVEKCGQGCKQGDGFKIVQGTDLLD